MLDRALVEEGKRREHETTTHLIQIPVFTHTSRVTNFGVFIIKVKAEKLGVLTCMARRQDFGAFPWI